MVHSLLLTNIFQVPSNGTNASIPLMEVPVQLFMDDRVCETKPRRLEKSLSITSGLSERMRLDVAPSGLTRAVSMEFLSRHGPDSIINTFSTGDEECIFRFARSLLEAAADDPVIVVTACEADGVIEAVVDSFSKFTREETVETYLQVLELFVKKNDQKVIDSELLFNLRVQMDSFPLLVLEFYAEICLASTYARNALICVGITDDVIDLCTSSTDPAVRLAACRVIGSVFDTISRVDVSFVHPLVSEILSLIKIVETPCVDILLTALVNVVDECSHAITSYLYDQDIHVFLSEVLDIPELQESAIELATRISQCETSKISLLIKAGVVPKISKLLSVPASFVFLGNCIESAPEVMKAVISREFICSAVELTKDCGDEMFRSVGFFIATLLLYAPSHIVVTFLKPEFMILLLDMLKCEVSELIVRSVEALQRIFLLSVHMKDVRMVVTDFFGKSTIVEDIRKLTTFDDTLVQDKAVEILRCLKHKE